MANLYGFGYYYRSLYTPFVQFMGNRSFFDFLQNFFDFPLKRIEIFSKQVYNKCEK